MTSKNCSRILTLGIVLMLLAATVQAQQKVYKWVDEEGVVHFSETPPAESESVETESFTTDRPPSYVSPAQPVNKSSAIPDAVDEKQSSRPQTEIPAAVEQTDITKMTLAELDRRCEDAREAKIAPLREAEIAKCKDQERNDPAWCERHNADYGNAGRTISGTFRPRMFNDLSECVEAEGELRKRNR